MNKIEFMRIKKSDMMEMFPQWIRQNANLFSSDEAVSLHQFTLQTVVAAFGVREEARQEHAIEAECALAESLFKKKVIPQSILNRIAKFRDKSCLRWDWAFEKEEKS